MARRKDRLRVVLDTNVVVAALLSTKRQSVNWQVLRLWFRRQLQLVVSEDVVAEYVLLLRRLRIPPKRVGAFHQRLRRQDIVTHVNLGPRFTASRDPDDNILLATAAAGRARFLITNDRDLLDIPTAQRRKFRFEIMTPQEFLTQAA